MSTQYAMMRPTPCGVCGGVCEVVSGFTGITECPFCGEHLQAERERGMFRLVPRVRLEEHLAAVPKGSRWTPLIHEYRQCLETIRREAPKWWNTYEQHLKNEYKGPGFVVWILGVLGLLCALFFFGFFLGLFRHIPVLGIPLSVLPFVGWLTYVVSWFRQHKRRLRSEEEALERLLDDRSNHKVHMAALRDVLQRVLDLPSPTVGAPQNQRRFHADT